MGWCCGEKNHRAKLKEVEVVKIRKLYSSNKFTQRKLGRMFGVTKHTIWYIVHRKTWRHI